MPVSFQNKKCKPKVSRGVAVERVVGGLRLLWLPDVEREVTLRSQEGFGMVTGS